MYERDCIQCIIPTPGFCYGLDENEPDPDEATPMEDTRKENLANGKPVKSKKGKRIAGEKRKGGDPAGQAPSTATVAKRVAKPPKDKKSKVKTTTKSRSSNRPRQGVIWTSDHIHHFI